MAHDDQFTATGPAFTGAGFQRAAFSTNRVGTDSTYGVNVQGSVCGVYGESVQTPPKTSRKVLKENTGVCGLGDDYGVIGRGRKIAGVYGETDGSSVAVAGISKNRRTPSNLTVSGSGVVGTTEGFRGFGVVGLTIDPRGMAKPVDLPIPRRDARSGQISFGEEVAGHLGGGTGVLGVSGIFSGAHWGESTGVFGVGRTGVAGEGTTAGIEGHSGGGVGVMGVGQTAGVEGNSESGIGVVGRSNSGAGAFFTSLAKDAVVGRSGGSGDAVRGSADNSIGVRGEAVAGVGVFGDSEKQSGVVGRSRGAFAPGVFGICDQMTGVAGRSNAAPGVFGESRQQAGVLGRSMSAAGVFGFGDATFTPSAPPVGVLGLNDKSVGVLGSSVEVIGVWGNTDRGLGVIGTTNFGAGVPTDRITEEGIGTIGLANSGVGVAGMSTSGTGVFGSSGQGLAGHFRGPVVIEGDMTVVGGIKSAAVPHPDGSYRRLYCTESPESWFEDIGEAQLEEGKRDVRLAPDFAELVEIDSYHVFLSAYGESAGLFVAERTATGFLVREQRGGTSDVSFAYRIVAKRKDVTAARLATVIPPGVSGDERLPDLRLQLASPDFERVSVSPFDLPGLTESLGATDSHVGLGEAKPQSVAAPS